MLAAASQGASRDGLRAAVVFCLSRGENWWRGDLDFTSPDSARVSVFDALWECTEHVCRG
jgi:hypothetical protein